MHHVNPTPRTVVISPDVQSGPPGVALGSEPHDVATPLGDVFGTGTIVSGITSLN